MNGRVEFDAGGVRLVEGLTGRMGGGEVRFGGRIGIRAGTIESYALTAVGRDMRLRYPEGFRSLVDADLALRGPVQSPVLTGTVQVKDALWIKPIDTEGAGIFGLAAAGGAAAAAPAQQAASTTLPLRFDVRIRRRRRCGSTVRRRVWSRAPISPCAAPTIGRCCSAAPTSTAASCCSRAIATS